MITSPESNLNSSESSGIRRVLVYRLGSLGDMLIALPALHLVARAFPHAERRMLTNFPVNVKAPAAAAVLEGTGLIHDYLRYTVGTRSPVELSRLWASIVRFRPQVLVYMAAGRGVAAAHRDSTFFRLCGISHQIGVPRSADTDQPQHEQPGAGRGLTQIGSPGYPAPSLPYMLEPEAARLTRNLAELGDPLLEDPASWDLQLTSSEQARAEELLSPVAGRPLLAVSVGTKVQAKDWGRENWQALLTRLAQVLPDHALALAGAPEEANASQFAAANWSRFSSGGVVNLCGKLTPRQSAAAFARARLFVGHDSGPMHLAASVGTPCVAIFAARNIPRVWFPYGRRHRVLYHRTDCWGCGLETCLVERKRCLTSITVEEAFSAVMASLMETWAEPS